MQFSWITVLIPPVIIVNPVGDIRCLLYLCDITAFADSVYRTCRNEKTVSFFDFLGVQQNRQCMIVQGSKVFRFVGILIETHNQFGIPVSTYQVPHFSYPIGVMTGFSACVVRVYQDGKIVPRNDVFD